MKLKLPAAMSAAFAEAEAAAWRGEVPVGAVVVDKAGAVLARAGNRTLELRDPTAHAEMLAIRAAAQVIGSERLVDCDLHVTLEPCVMCAGAISFARIRRLYYAADDVKMGGARFFNESTCHHAPEVYSGIGEERSRLLLQAFFKSRR